MLPVYIESLKQLEKAGAEWVQLDEPALVLDLDDATRTAYAKAYAQIRAATKLKIFVATYFGALGDNADTALHLPVDALHLDLVRGTGHLDTVLAKTPPKLILSLGVVDGRKSGATIWSIPCNSGTCREQDRQGPDLGQRLHHRCCTRLMISILKRSSIRN